MPNGPMRITSGPFEPELYKSEFEVQDGELKVGWKRIINRGSALRGSPCLCVAGGEGGKESWKSLPGRGWGVSSKRKRRA